jgi:hypothetical protein
MAGGGKEMTLMASKLRLTISVLLALVLVLAGWGVYAQMQVRQLEKTVLTVHNQFEYKNEEHNLTLSIPLKEYLSYKERQRPSWLNYNQYHPYFFFAEYAAMARDPGDDAIIENVVDYLNNLAAAEQLDDRQRIDLSLAFVQSITYGGDNVTTASDEYPRYPVETLFEKEGDCEDTSILLAAILNDMGYDVALLLFEEFDHMGLGINYPLEYGNSWLHDGRRYWYLDTSGKHSAGWAPDPYDETSAYIYPVGG